MGLAGIRKKESNKKDHRSCRGTGEDGEGSIQLNNPVAFYLSLYEPVPVCDLFCGSIQSHLPKSVLFELSPYVL